MRRPRRIRPAALHGLSWRPLRASHGVRYRPESMARRNIPGSAGLRSDTRSVPFFRLVERRLVSVLSCSYDLVVPALAISLVAVRARNSHAPLFHSWNYQFNESFRAGVRSGIHVHGHLVQGTHMARRRVDRHFRGSATFQHRTVLAMLLGGLIPDALGSPREEFLIGGLELPNRLGRRAGWGSVQWVPYSL